MLRLVTAKFYAWRGSGVTLSELTMAILGHVSRKHVQWFTMGHIPGELVGHVCGDYGCRGFALL